MTNCRSGIATGAGSAAANCGCQSPTLMESAFAFHVAKELATKDDHDPVWVRAATVAALYIVAMTVIMLAIVTIRSFMAS